MWVCTIFYDMRVWQNAYDEKIFAYPYAYSTRAVFTRMQCNNELTVIGFHVEGLVALCCWQRLEIQNAWSITGIITVRSSSFNSHTCYSFCIQVMYGGTYCVNVVVYFIQTHIHLSSQWHNASVNSSPFKNRNRYSYKKANILYQTENLSAARGNLFYLYIRLYEYVGNWYQCWRN